MILTRNKFLIVISMLIIMPTVSCSGGEMPNKKKHELGNSIKLDMSLSEVSEFNCRGLVPLQPNKIKHKVNDNRVRKYLRYKPPLSVVMKESDLNSYFELIFEEDKLKEINKYDEKGGFIKSLKEIHCF